MRSIISTFLPTPAEANAEELHRFCNDKERQISLAKANGAGIGIYRFNEDRTKFDAVYTIGKLEGQIGTETGRRIAQFETNPLAGFFSIDTFWPGGTTFAEGRLRIYAQDPQSTSRDQSYVVSYIMKPTRPMQYQMGIKEGTWLYFSGIAIGDTVEGVLSVSWNENVSARLWQDGKKWFAEWGYRISEEIAALDPSDIP